MRGEEKSWRNSFSSGGRRGGGGGVPAAISGTGYMAHGGDILGSRRRCSYKRATALVCSVNVIAILYVLHSLFNPLNPQVPHSVPLARLKTPLRNGTEMPLVLRYSREELERIKEAHEVRRAAEPHDLMRRVKEIELESVIEAAKDKEDEATKQKVAADLAQRLRELRGDSNQRSQQEALDEWRRKKIEQARKRGQDAKGKEDSVDAKLEAQEEEVVAKTLELGWGPLLEAAGLTLPEEKSNEKVQGGKLILKGPEIEDGIIPGRPVPPTCNAEPHTDYDGVAVRWGLTHHTESAADCCQACLDQAKAAKNGEMKCNVWVYCPAEEGCFSPDIYEHKQFECWLKQAEKPKINFKGRYPEDYRQAHPNCPRVVAWVSGVI